MNYIQMIVIKKPSNSKVLAPLLKTALTYFNRFQKKHGFKTKKANVANGRNLALSRIPKD